MTEPHTDEDAWIEAELARIQADRNRDDIAQIARTVAGLVIGRTEHARVIRELRAASGRYEQEIAFLRRALDDVRHELQALTTVVDDLVEAVVTQNAEQGLVSYSHVNAHVQRVDARLDLVEKALPEIERRLKLRRRDTAWSPGLDDGQ